MKSSKIIVSMIHKKMGKNEIIRENLSKSHKYALQKLPNMFYNVVMNSILKYKDNVIRKMQQEGYL